MSRYRVSPPARLDLHEIWTYLADHANIDRADRVIRELHEGMSKLAETPGIGHRREDLADESLRVWNVFSYLIIYRPETRPVQIVRVVHGARDLPNVLEEEA